MNIIYNDIIIIYFIIEKYTFFTNMLFKISYFINKYIFYLIVFIFNIFQKII